MLIFKKSFPSLIRCYKSSKLACCSSVHDDLIDNRLNEVFTSSCLRIFETLQDFFCFGCHPGESYFINLMDKTITICQKYAKEIWLTDNLNNITTAYDQCGIRTSSSLSFLTNKNFIYPSQVNNNSTTFYFSLK